eukprot:596525-Rhodomonas_salina.1
MRGGRGILKRGRSGSWKKPKLLDGASLRDLHALHADLHAPHSAPASHVRAPEPHSSRSCGWGVWVERE